MNEYKSIGRLVDVDGGAGRETAEGMLRRQMAQLEERLASKRALLEIVLKAAPLTEQADRSLLELLWREDLR